MTKNPFIRPIRPEVNRAHALITAEARHMDLFAKALNEIPELDGSSVPADASAVDPLRQSEYGQLDTPGRLQAAMSMSRRAAMSDPVLKALNQRVYGTLPEPGDVPQAAYSDVVIDVHAREVREQDEHPADISVQKET